MPLPLYGSGGLTFRTSAAVCPTSCLSMPETTTSVGCGTSKLMPGRGVTTTGCEKPTVSSRSEPRSAARKPTPWISRRFWKPFVTPSTMFATSERVSPCSARSSPRSVGRVTTSVSSSFATEMRAGSCWLSSPSGPLTWMRPAVMATLTPEGSSMGCRPIRLILDSPDEADDLAADPLLLGRAARHDAVRGGQDGRAHAAQHTGQPVLARVHAPAWLRDPLEVGDDALAVTAVLQLDDELVEAVAVLDPVVADIALLLQEAGDLHLGARGRHLHGVVERLVRDPDPGEHVGDGISEHRSLLPRGLRHAGDHALVRELAQADPT